MLIEINGMVGYFATDEPNRNGRIYPKEVFERELKKYKEKHFSKELKRELRRKKLNRVFNGGDSNIQK